MIESFGIVWGALPYLLQGTGVTVVCVVAAMLVGFILGVPMALIQVYGPLWARRVVGLYVWFFRGVPILVLLFLFYFGLCNFLGLNLGAISAASLVLGMTSAAYQSQIFRGSLGSLPHGQFRAASALGMSDLTAIRSIILPQALRLSIPGWSNEYSILLKDSAVAFVLGTPEIMARTHFVASRTYEHLPLYITAGILYFILTWIGVNSLRMLEKKVRIPGYGH
ncbi:MAG: amino acid ABC transporter permease [Deltaproteobacteria bacterium]|nr:amino acid ABC transporter permease [Deltaproteobacteria bacterium]